MRTTARRTTVITAAALLATAVIAPTTASATQPAQGPSPARLFAVGLADGGTDLVLFRTDRPGRLDGSAEVRGLVDGERRLVGIDVRVQNGKLYGVGERGGLYVIDQRGRATKVGALSVPLEGTAFGVDFNPAANALRVISDTGQDLRQPFPAAVAGAYSDGPAAPTVVDGPLTNPATPPATARVAATGVTGAAYVNNDLDPVTGTNLFDLDTALDRVSQQVPANDGTLAPTGGLRVDASLDAGFDVYSTLTAGATTSNQAFATLGTAQGYRLYAVDLLSGATQDLGAFRQPVTDIAVVPTQP